MAIAWPIIVEAYRTFGAPECTITSGTEGRHSRKSLHYKGLAIDIRGGSQSLADYLQVNLGGDYDVVFEIDHIHVEYDPAR
jgi:hypothetical protein